MAAEEPVPTPPSGGQEALRSQTEEVRLLAEAASHLGEGILVTSDRLDAPGPEILFVNKAMSRITGYTSEELTGRSPRILQGAKTDRETLNRLRAEMSAGRPCRVELVNYRKDGTPYDAELFVTPLADAAGNRTNFVSIHRDVTERKRAEAARESFGTILEESLNEIYIFHADSLRFLQVNRGGRNNLGYSMEELRTMTPLDLKPTFTRDRFEALLEPLRTGARGEVLFDGWHQRADGSRYDVEAHLQFTNFREEPCFVAIILDTTERRKLEQEVVNATEEERQRIARDIHDDLGSLLTGIKFRIEALSSVLDAADGNKARNCAAIADLVREAITQTRGIAHGLRPVGTHPEDLMSALRGLGERLGAAPGVRCVFCCDAPVPVDDPLVANHLFRIAQEAVNNALKYSGGSEVSISLRGGDGTVTLEVSDNGTGFDVHAARDRGLGLHIMNYRARAMDAALRVRRREQGGTEVVCKVANPHRRPGGD